MNNLPRIGLMLGDMTGIGPEISAKVLAAGTFKPLARIAVIGDARVLELGIKDAGVKLKWKNYADVDAIDWSRDEIPLVDLGNVDPATIKRGEMSPVSGKLTGDTLKHMIDLALAGKLDGISFAPLNKGAMHKGGWKFHDEHQMFAALTQHAGFFGEMNVIKEFATFRVTSHVALREAINMITPERITSAVGLADDHRPVRQKVHAQHRALKLLNEGETRPLVLTIELFKKYTVHPRVHKLAHEHLPVERAELSGGLVETKSGGALPHFHVRKPHGRGSGPRHCAPRLGNRHRLGKLPRMDHGGSRLARKG